MTWKSEPAFRQDMLPATKLLLAAILRSEKQKSGPPAEPADESSLKENHPAPQALRSGQNKNGARPCESNGATPPTASQPTLALISE
jgi:hypothetical protein